MRPHILLTGGTGLIGPAIIDKLVHHGYRLTVLYRDNKPVMMTDVTCIKIDFTDNRFDLCNTLSGVDIVVHNAASLKLGNTTEELDEIQAINIEFTERLFRSAAASGVKKIVFTSTLSLLKRPFAGLITETDAVEPGSHYARSKYYGEELLKKLYEEYGIGYNILRVSSPVGSNLSTLHNTVVKKWITEAALGKSIHVYGTGNRAQDFVSITDIAEAFYLCILNLPVNGIFNIASGTHIFMFELAKMIADKFSVRYENVGIDPNEGELWNISIKKANQLLHYIPEYSSISVINSLLNSIEQ